VDANKKDRLYVNLDFVDQIKRKRQEATFSSWPLKRSSTTIPKTVLGSNVNVFKLDQADEDSCE
jgi:hypothetical protein